jgi:hypothetical protein
MCLCAFEIGLVAKTFNHRLTAICVPFLRHRIAAAKNARRMTRLFPLTRVPVLAGIDEYELYRQWKLPGDLCPYPDPRSRSAMAPFPCLDYLDLRGDLGWTALARGHRPVPLGYTIDEWFHDPAAGSAASRARMEKFVALAKQLGLSIPSCFTRFMIDADVHSRFPDAHNAFEFGLLRKAKNG